MPYIPTEPVESSNLERVGYDRKTSTLRIVFGGNRTYDYPMVPESEYKKLLAAESLGKFFNTRIKPMYAYRTPRPEELEPPKEDEVSDVPPVLPRTPTGEIDYAAIPDATHLFKQRNDLLGVPCRCCGLPLLVPPEDACDLCVACYAGKGGDTDLKCTVHCDHDWVDATNQVVISGTMCPTCGTIRSDWKTIGEHEHPQLTSEPED